MTEFLYCSEHPGVEISNGPCYACPTMTESKNPLKTAMNLFKTEIVMDCDTKFAIDLKGLSNNTLELICEALECTSEWQEQCVDLIHAELTDRRERTVGDKVGRSVDASVAATKKLFARLPKFSFKNDTIDPDRS
jgi:hypothetical protein